MRQRINRCAALNFKYRHFDTRGDRRLSPAKNSDD